MIFDPDGTSAITDDGRMAVPVFHTQLDAYGFPTGERRRIGWMDPRDVGNPLAGIGYIDHIDLD